MKKYIVYQITNLVNKKFYVGVHQTNNIDDGYMSSSNVVNDAIKKYGKENFKKEVLFEFNDAETMFAKEAEIVNEDFVKRKDTYNLKTGGTGSTSHLNDGSEEHKQRCRDANNYVKNRYDISQHAEEFRFDLNKEHRLKVQAKANSPEAIAKKKETFKEIKHQQGKKNSQFGKRWIYSLVEKRSKSILKSDLIPEGWLEGRKMKF
jgi:hypothetical protein